MRRSEIDSEAAMTVADHLSRQNPSAAGNPADAGGARFRLSALVRGAVQGVGFRPVVYRLARELRLDGWVSNTGQGVRIEVEGAADTLDRFLLRMACEAPPRAFIQGIEHRMLEPVGHAGFEIRPSAGGQRTVLIQPDTAVCPDCLRELFDPADRRHRYPFINCTHCGPRFSIIEALPYDRPNTTMRRFEMCPACRAEYGDPADRRFHAQPTACPECGPHLALWDADGAVLAQRDEALMRTADALRSGAVVAIKGLGGYQLLVDARREAAVRRLRERKRREEKPFALMFPTVAIARAVCGVEPSEERLLTSPEAPIVLLRRRDESDAAIAPAVAPGNPNLGAMLPTTPLHHLLMRELGFPAVATSGNLSDEPICIDEREALTRLRGLADLFLVHDRPIARHVDDSIVRIMAGRELVLRRARGYAPLPITLAHPLPPVLAVGAHLKNTVALAIGRDVFLSQHIGDLETPEAGAAFRRATEDLPRLFETAPAAVACDRHPDYLSTHHARSLGLPLLAVQHHYAHALACMAENEIEPPALAIVWDGTGWGPDGTIWGGEFLEIAESGWRRLARLRPFPLPGGEAAVREGRRAALGLLWAWRGSRAFTERNLPPLASFTSLERRNLETMLARGLNSPLTSSMGRLFDAVAALIGLRQSAAFEGQAAMLLEWAAQGHIDAAEPYPFDLIEDPAMNPAGRSIDWGPMLERILSDLSRGLSLGIVAAKFHNTATEMAAAVAREAGLPRVVLTGGCFQNRILLEGVVARLRRDGFRPYWHQRVPPGDGSIALGQAVAAGRETPTQTEA
jgi:hydrogenase maturation protein HypF